MRRITGLWFGGAGEYSEQCANLLHQRLDDALNILSSLQQTSMGQVEDVEYRDELQSDYDDCIEDIVAGIAGRKYAPSDRLSYPGEWIFLPHKEPDLTLSRELWKLKRRCSEYLEFVRERHRQPADFDHFVFEAAMELFYGNEIWKEVNEALK